MKCVTLFTVPFFPVTSSRFSVTGGQLGFICTEGAGVEVYSSAVGGGRQEKLPPPNQCPTRSINMMFETKAAALEKLRGL